MFEEQVGEIVGSDGILESWIKLLIGCSAAALPARS